MREARPAARAPIVCDLAKIRGTIFRMTVSQMRLLKTETRDMADRVRVGASDFRIGTHEEWKMSNGTFFISFVVITATIAVLALVLRLAA